MQREAKEEGRRQRRQGEAWRGVTLQPLLGTPGQDWELCMWNWLCLQRTWPGVLRSSFLCQVGSLDYNGICPSHWLGGVVGQQGRSLS